VRGLSEWLFEAKFKKSKFDAGFENIADWIYGMGEGLDM